MDEEERRRRTTTLAGARDDARAQAASSGLTGPTIPVEATADRPEGVGAHDLRWHEVLGAGGYAARVLPRDTLLRIDDLDGDACVQLLAYDAANTAERLNVADTVKVQWQAYVSTGAVLLSDLGRVLLTIVEDTSGSHDCLCGASNRRANDRRYGDGSASGPTPSGRDLLALAGLKHGLGRVDIAPCVNLFRQVAVAEDGSLTLEPSSGPAHVVLRAETDVLVLLADTPHPLDDRPDYTAGRIQLTAWSTPRPAPDPWRTTSPERERAFLNTEDHRLETLR